MTVHVTVKCDGMWDDGKMPCRAALSGGWGETPAIDLLTKATDAGWKSTLNRDLCPAHAAKESTR